MGDGEEDGEEDKDKQGILDNENEADHEDEGPQLSQEVLRKGKGLEKTTSQRTQSYGFDSYDSGMWHGQRNFAPQKEGSRHSASFTSEGNGRQSAGEAEPESLNAGSVTSIRTDEDFTEHQPSYSALSAESPPASAKEEESLPQSRGREAESQGEEPGARGQGGRDGEEGGQACEDRGKPEGRRAAAPGRGGSRLSGKCHHLAGHHEEPWAGGQAGSPCNSGCDRGLASRSYSIITT